MRGHRAGRISDGRSIISRFLNDVSLLLSAAARFVQTMTSTDRPGAAIARRGPAHEAFLDETSSIRRSTPLWLGS